ncbi:MAG: S-layer homology domain-containing protein, partial [Candidatus Ornithomonoglobus sp.]
NNNDYYEYIPEKLMDDVADVIVDWYDTVILRKDGSLWSGGQRINKVTNSTAFIKILDSIKLPRNNSDLSTLVPTPTPTIISLYSFGSGSIGNWCSYTVNAYNSPYDTAQVTIENTEIAEAKDSALKLYSATDLKGEPYKLTSLDIWCKSAGITNVTVTLPDGTSATEELTVMAETAETLDDETILRAKIMLDNPLYQYYRDSTSITQQMMQNRSADGAVLYKQAKDFFSTLITGEDDREDYYEAVLLDLLSREESEKFFGSYSEFMENNIIKYFIKDFYGDTEDIAGVISDEFLDKDYLKELLDKHPDLNSDLKKCFEREVGNIQSGSSVKVNPISAMYLAAGTMDDFVERATAMYGLTKESDLKIHVLNTIINNTSCDSSLRNAAENVKEQLLNSVADGGIYMAQEGFKAGTENLAEYTTGKLIDTLAESNPYVLLYKKTYDLSFAFNDLFFNADDITQGFISLEAINYIETAVRDGLSGAQTTFEKNETSYNAEELLACAEMLRSVLLSGCDYTIDFMEAAAKANMNVNSFKAMLKDWPWVDSEQLWNQVYAEAQSDNDKIEAVRAHKDKIKNADFYSLGEKDIAEYICREVSTAVSSWAQGYVDKAKSYDILPDYMQNNYQNNITRAEFCTLLEKLLEKKTGAPIDWLILCNGTFFNREFDDAMFQYVNDIAQLGIVDGIDNRTFAPLGEITRQQAAKMLCAAAKVLKYDTSAPDTDLSGVADWAVEGVNFVVDRGIMTGTDNGFEPEGTYTKEQAITTMVRFFENLK